LGISSVLEFFDGQIQPPFVIASQDLDGDFLPFAQVFGHAPHELVGDLRNVHQTGFAALFDFDECTEIGDPRYFTFYHCA
jgi:hypothetical protein